MYHSWSSCVPRISKSALEHALDVFDAPQDLVLEFGMYSGRTLGLIANAMPNSTVYGFDSFEGLPERWRDGYEKGMFKVDTFPDVPENVELVVGWFEETLPEFIKKHAGKTVGFVHIDCDIYSSTKTIFDALAPMFRDGTIITFDEAFNYPEWEQHEMKAFSEFLEVHPEFTVEWLGMQEGGQPATCRLLTQR